MIAGVGGVESDWNDQLLGLTHLQARWSLKPVVPEKRFAEIVVIECSVNSKTFRIFLTIDEKAERIRVLDVWKKSGNIRAQAKAIQAAFEQARDMKEGDLWSAK